MGRDIFDGPRAEAKNQEDVWQATESVLLVKATLAARLSEARFHSSLRDVEGRGRPQPWVETHGYVQAAATRRGYARLNRRT